MAGDDPPFLPVGTEVSAKYRGAFCEAKVKKIVKTVKCKVYVKETLTSVQITDDCVTKGQLKCNSVVEFKHPDSGQLTEGVVSKLTDCSMYTVVFDDGDEKTLRRTQCVLKGEKHFIESETLDNLPLSHPEHFGTPVMNNKSKRRLGRTSTGFGDDNDDSEESSSDESTPKRATYKGRHQELVGKIMLVEMGDKRKQLVPVLVVLPDAHTTELKTKDHILVKSFKDGKFYNFLRKELKDFSKPSLTKLDDKSLKTAVDKAMAYHDNEELPNSWERDELLGTDEEDQSDIEESSDDEQSEDKDHFVAQLYKFMDDRGTPINKGPFIGNKDLNLYKLFRLVQNIGGYNKVTNLAKWRAVYKKMELPPSNTASHQIKNAYKKYLHAFEDFYRKLGSSMGTISRPGRSRNNSGRGIVPFRSHGRDGEKSERGTETKKSEKNEESDGEKEEKEETQPKKGVTTPKRERLTRRELVDLSRDAKEKRDGSKDSRMSDKRSPARKDEKRDEPTKKIKLPKKEEVKEVKGNEDLEEKTKKVNRRRSLRKDENKKEEAEENQTEEKKPEKDVKPKAKTVADKKEKKEEKEEKSTIKKEEKKEETKVSKGKAVKKEAKKETELETEKKPSKKENAKKSKEKEEEGEKSASAKKKKHVTEEDEEEEEDEPDTKVVHHNECYVGTKLQVKYGRGKTHKVYDAKIIESQKEGGQIQYLVHYAGWNMRYDEWIKPERIVSITSRPDIVSRKKLDSPPKSPKGTQQTKKAKSSTAPTVTTPSPLAASKPVPEVRPVKKSPAHVTTPSTKNSKPRCTRSNSIEVKVENLPAKRRTRKNSGVTESSDVVSQGSSSDIADDIDTESENQYQNTESKTEDIKEGGTSPKEHDDNKESLETPEITKEPEVLSSFEQEHNLEESEDVMDQGEDDSCDLSAVEQDLLNRAAEIQKNEESAAENKEKEEDKTSVRKEEKIVSVDMNKITSFESNNMKKDDAQIQVHEESTNKEVDLTEVKAEKHDKVKENLMIAKEEEVPVINKESQQNEEDKFQFKGDVEVNLPDIVPEKDLRERAVKEKVVKEKEKLEVESEKKVTKGRKKEAAKMEKKDNQTKEPKREVKRGRPSLAEKKAAEELNHVAKENVEVTEPPMKKAKEEKKEVVEKVELKKEEKDLDNVECSNEEMKKEENEVERKKVKKKVKKKDNDIADVTKESVRSPKGNKGEKVCNKGKGKKQKDGEVCTDIKVLELGAVESLGRLGDTDTVQNVTSASNAIISNTVINSDTCKASDEPCQVSYSATDISVEVSSKDHGANSESESKLDNTETDHNLKEQTEGNSALYDNTPPTTPEHEGEDPSSQEHSQDSISSSTKMANINIVNERQYGSESPTGNASPSSNDGSIGSGNVACSESSNNEAQATSSLGKRRRESDDVSASKRKRRGKSKQERKNSAKLAGSDSDETYHHDQRFSPEPGSASPSKSHRSHSPRTPKYHLNLEEGKYLEGERRIAFLMDKIQEIRKIYMNLKSEVACIDRRRKRARRKDRESTQNSSGGTAGEGEITR